MVEVTSPLICSAVLEIWCMQFQNVVSSEVVQGVVSCLKTKVIVLFSGISATGKAGSNFDKLFAVTEFHDYPIEL